MGNNGTPPTSSSDPAPHLSPHSSSSPLVPNMEAIMAAAKIQRNPSGTGEHVPVSSHEDIPHHQPVGRDLHSPTPRAREEGMEIGSVEAS